MRILQKQKPLLLSHPERTEEGATRSLGRTLKRIRQIPLQRITAIFSIDRLWGASIVFLVISFGILI